MIINKFPGTHITAELLNPKHSNFCEVFYESPLLQPEVVMATVTRVLLIQVRFSKWHKKAWLELFTRVCNRVLFVGIASELHSRYTCITSIPFENNYYDLMGDEVKSIKQDFSTIKSLL